jgi:aminoglycoside 6'-N-acetyltransferase
VILRGERVALRTVTEGEVHRLVAILQEPAVAARWGHPGGDLETDIRRDFLGLDTAFTIELDGEVVGAVGATEEPTPQYRHAGIDTFLTAERHNQGLGTDAVRAMARYLIHERGHHRLTIDPAADNATAIRCYEKVGFRPVGVMRRYEQGPEGTWHDGVLMELLAEDLDGEAAPHP